MSCTNSIFGEHTHTILHIAHDIWNRITNSKHVHTTQIINENIIMDFGGSHIWLITTICDVCMFLCVWFFSFRLSRYWRVNHTFAPTANLPTGEVFTLQNISYINRKKSRAFCAISLATSILLCAFCFCSFFSIYQCVWQRNRE